MKKFFYLTTLVVVIFLIVSACTTAGSDLVSTSSTQVSFKDGMVMVYVPAGEFLMGSPEGVGYDYEHPQQTVFLDAYWIDQTEVTNAMFAKFVKETGYITQAEKDGQANIDDIGKFALTEGANWAHPMGPDSNIEGRDQYPVEHISWNDAQAYCEWAGRTLPTESQWEKAARGSDGRSYPWGNTPPNGQDANTNDSNYGSAQSDLSIDDGYQFTAPVGSYPDGASPFGALDMAGNVFEWVKDGSDTAYAVNWTTSDHSVIRGGSYANSEDTVRAALRVEIPATVTDPGIGFRCALPTQSENADSLPPATESPTPTPDAERFAVDVEKLSSNPPSYDYLVSHPEEFVEAPDPWAGVEYFNEWRVNELTPAMGDPMSREPNVQVDTDSIGGGEFSLYCNPASPVSGQMEFFYFNHNGTLYPVYLITSFRTSDQQLLSTIGVILLPDPIPGTASDHGFQAVDLLASGEYAISEVITFYEPEPWGNFPQEVNDLIASGFSAAALEDSGKGVYIAFGLIALDKR